MFQWPKGNKGVDYSGYSGSASHSTRVTFVPLNIKGGDGSSTPIQIRTSGTVLKKNTCLLGTLKILAFITTHRCSSLVSEVRSTF